MELKWLNKALDKMSRGHVFVISLVLVVIIGMTPVLTSYTQTTKLSNIDKQLSDISWNLLLMRNGNMNNLTLSSAKEISRIALRASKYKIIEDIHRVITMNNVEDSLRQTLIRSALKSKIEGYYSADYHMMTRLYYEDTQLSTIWDEFSVEIVVDNICRMLFDPVYNDNHELLRTDLMSMLDQSFDRFYDITADRLEEME